MIMIKLDLYSTEDRKDSFMEGDTILHIHNKISFIPETIQMKGFVLDIFDKTSINSEGESTIEHLVFWYCPKISSEKCGLNAVRNLGFFSTRMVLIEKTYKIF